MSANVKLDAESQKELDWIQLRTDFEIIDESNWMKFTRKFRENPLVPTGAILTLAALTLGLRSFKNGQSKVSQHMMRFRIAAQGFTVLAIILGVGISGKVTKKNNKE